MMWIEEKYIMLVSHKLVRFKKRGRVFNFRCPRCLDSQKSKSKARGYFYPKNNGYSFKCHNCGETDTFHWFLRDFDNSLYEQYCYELLQEGGERFSSSTTHAIKKEQTSVESALSGIQRVSTLDQEHQAVKYLKSRKIPVVFHAKLYYCKSFKKFVNSLIPDKLTTFDEARLVIPLQTRMGTLVGFQGRAFGETTIRYITIILEENLGRIWGLDTVDLNRRYYVLEGPFDAMCLDNSLAVCGSDIETAMEKIDADKNLAVIVYDKEPRNKEIISKMEQTIKAGWKLCIWPVDFEFKDVNDGILGGLQSSEILHTIDCNIQSGLMAELALSDWRRV